MVAAATTKQQRSASLVAKSAHSEQSSTGSAPTTATSQQSTLDDAIGSWSKITELNAGYNTVDSAIAELRGYIETWLKSDEKLSGVRSDIGNIDRDTLISWALKGYRQTVANKRSQKKMKAKKSAAGGSKKATTGAMQLGPRSNVSIRV